MEDDVWSLYRNFLFAELVYLLFVLYFLKQGLIAENSCGIQGDIAWIGGRRRGRIGRGGNCRQQGRSSICGVRRIRDVMVVCVGGFLPVGSGTRGRKLGGRFVDSKCILLT